MPVARGVGRPPFATRLSTVIDSEQNKVIIYGYDDFFPSDRLNHRPVADSGNPVAERSIKR